jgi:hypothetical protein
MLDASQSGAVWAQLFIFDCRTLNVTNSRPFRRGSLGDAFYLWMNSPGALHIGTLSHHSKATVIARPEQAHY